MTANLQRAARIRQSALQKAFAGELRRDDAAQTRKYSR